VIPRLLVEQMHGHQHADRKRPCPEGQGVVESDHGEPDGEAGDEDELGEEKGGVDGHGRFQSYECWGLPA
jgi:hypothetical protein